MGMDITYKDLKDMIDQSVEEAFQKHGPPHCPLQDVGISHDMHKEHHRKLDQYEKDLAKIRTGFIAGVLVTITGGLFGLIWFGLKSKFFGG